MILPERRGEEAGGQVGFGKKVRKGKVQHTWVAHGSLEAACPVGNILLALTQLLHVIGHD